VITGFSQRNVINKINKTNRLN